MAWKTFDGHNDFLLRLVQAPDQREAIWLKGNGKGHLDLPRMKAGGFAAGFFAIYIPSPVVADMPDLDLLMENPPYTLPLPELIGARAAQPIATAMAGQLLWMERSSEGAFKVVRTMAELRECLSSGVIAGIMHMEGAEAIDESLDALYLYHQMGLRSLGPVWSRPTIFGHGVPFSFPGTPDTGDGLTDAGKRLVKACNELGILLDLSHLNEKGFDDIAALSDAPLVATHSNAWAVTPSTRNLTDRQLSVIRETGGLVGLNFATCFLREDGKMAADMSLDPMLRHLDHLLEKLGEDGVGFGSDFDGATVPEGIADVTGLPPLTDAMEAHGYGAELMKKLTMDNWVSVLGRTWKA